MRMIAFLSALRADLSRPLPYIAWASGTVVMAVAGPFGSYTALSVAERLAYWGSAMAAGVAVGISVRAFVFGSLGVVEPRRATLIVAVIATLLLTWPLRELAILLFPKQTGFTASLGDAALLIFSVALTIGAFREVMARGSELARLTPLIDEGSPLPKVVQRLEPELQGRLIAMTVRDHYVDIFTTQGRGAVLMRFADAMAEVAPEQGGQIHRSHWVAWWAVKAVERSPGKLWVRLCPELRLPVSRTYRDRLEARGLLETTPVEVEAEPLAAE